MLAWTFPGPQGKGSVPSLHKLRVRKQGCWSVGCGHAWRRIQILICEQSGVSSMALALTQGLPTLNSYCVLHPILRVPLAVFTEPLLGTRILLLEDLVI